MKRTVGKFAVIARNGAKYYPHGESKLKYWNCIRMTVTRSNGLVVTPDLFSGTALGSSLNGIEAQFL
jgi:hypothetical protein